MVASACRLDKILSNLGLTTRSKCMDYIIRNNVRVEGKMARPKDHVDPHLVTSNGEPLPYLEHLNILLNKPRGYVCSRAREHENKIVYDLLPSSFLHRRPPLVPAGRLDKWASGALVLSQDGDLIQRLTSPSKKSGALGKVYHILLQRPLTGEESKIFESGELILRSEQKPCKPAILEQLDDSGHLIRVTLYEGRYHQLRRMLAAIGNKTVTIERKQIGPIVLGDLPIGCWREITDAEVEMIR
ncbi:uncharacterized RNA pseudouridine synthase YtzG-like [Schistocerca gregaria]|uniref:uncharacterized RNA pseudouridine synthase YtzG-like n=1 Tax=Schistocerca gregaria TaxID=7010 RepID=UPI00211EF6EB|nr:uncharacterized RNA pseudouridine synthase YtzG-like [Schistocerca gregaria]